MFDVSKFHDLASGRRSGVKAMLLRAMLNAAEVPYTAAVRWRNWRFDAVATKVRRVGVPVISVGNLTTGGTGKTPMVRWLARWFRERGVRVTLISRGYGARQGSINDEALELEQDLRDVPHLQNPDRVAAAKIAVEELDCQLILLDDAFQHRRIHRDLDIVLLDAARPFGFGHLLPRGLLREPLSGLARADVVVLTRADMIDSDRRRAIRQQVRRHTPDAAWLEAIHRPQALRSADGRQQAASLLAGQKVAAFCGIGNPDGFRHTLDQCGYEVFAWREFPDHHDYRAEDIDALIDWTDGHGELAGVICTHKDLVKIGLERLGSQPLWALSVGLEIVSGRDDLEARLKPLLPPAPASDAHV